MYHPFPMLSRELVEEMVVEGAPILASSTSTTLRFDTSHKIICLLELMRYDECFESIWQALI